MIRILYVLYFIHACSSTFIFNILDDGAIGDGITDNTVSIRKTLARAANITTSSIVLIPDGDFLTGSLRISSHVTINMSKNAILRASDNASTYDCVPSITSDTGPCDFPFILIDEAVDVSLIGDGLIDGGANSPPGHLVREYRMDSNMLMPLEWPLIGCTYFSCRPKLLVIRNSFNITIINLTIANSPLWSVTVVESESILFDHVVIMGDRRWPNNDGIDLINSRHVTIQNCNISTGDDCIAIVTHSPSDMFNITVRNMSLKSTSAAIKISSFEANATGNIYDVLFQNIQVHDSNRGVAFMPRWGSGRLSNFLFENIYMETHFFGLDWWGTGEPIHLSSFSMREDRLWTGTIKNITFKNLFAFAEQSIILASNTSLLEDIELNNVSIIISRWSNYTAHPLHDYRPSIEPQTLVAKVDGIYACNIDKLTLENVKIEYYKPAQPYYGHCLNMTNTKSSSSLPLVYCLLP